MRKILLIVLLCFANVLAHAQQLNNEWIDFSKTYYKFKVAVSGLYRITTADLNAAGLANEPVQNLQVWRNGKQVAIYTSVASGTLGSGYIELYGQQNDGTLDRELYRTPNLQLSDRVSLQTDTSAYFLTVNSGGNNLRYVTGTNDVANNNLASEPFFIYQMRYNFMKRVNRGFASPAGGEYLYSSSYDIGEMMASDDIYPGSPVTINLSNLAVATGGPNAIFRASVAGNSPPPQSPFVHYYKIEINNTVVKDTTLSRFNAVVNVNPSVPLSVISSNAASIKISNNTPTVTDRIVTGFFELNYPRKFDFGNLTNFPFNLNASATGRYLEITNFNSNGSVPVLYDLTNNRRYVADVAGGVIRIVLPPLVTASDFVLVSQATSSLEKITPLEQRNFIDYKLAANQADYIIISHATLQVPYNGANQVELYRAYRATAVGGSFNSKIYNIDELVDQFAFGVKKHPLSVKNFLKFARNNFSIPPKFCFIIGHGLSYDDYRTYKDFPQAEKLNLIPTWGYPASDVLLASNGLDPVIATPIGRISVLTPEEIARYFSKVKEYELNQANTAQTIENKAWMKNVVHVAGANDLPLDQRLTGYLRSFENIITDTLFGGVVSNFNKSTTGPVTPIVSSVMEQKFETGISLLTYFGHSSATSLDYNLSDPENYNNPGKYPMFIVLGCNAGNLYAFDTSRFSLLSTLSEKFVLAKERGSIGFIASTHFGLENHLSNYTNQLYRSIGVTRYGRSIGENMQEAAQKFISGGYTFELYMHAEQSTLNGDPAIKINSNPLPDFAIEQSQIRINPSIVSVADNKFSVKAYLYNLGKATGDSVMVSVKRQYPDGSSEILLSKKIRSIRYIDSVSVEAPIVGSRDKGDNKITVTLDENNVYTEASELNNSATVTFNIFEDELTPVYPYNFSIVNKQGVKLIASTANPIGTSRQYAMEIDTTELFNSSFKVSRTATSSGGIIEFDPGISFSDSMVYYWRVAPVPTTGTYRWNSASFVYLNGSEAGFNQSHFFQHTKSQADRIYIDSASRKWTYKNALNNLTIVNSIFPTSGTEDNQFSVSVNGSTYIASACDGPVIQFNVFDPVTFKPWKNKTVNGVGLNGSTASDCSPTRNYNFDFLFGTPAQRLKAIKFMDSIPDGFIVVVRDVISATVSINKYVNDWKADAAINGANNTLYHRLVEQGFNTLDSFYKPRAFGFVYKKNDPSMPPVSRISEGLLDRITLSVNIATADTLGYVTSPKFGPAVAWKQVKWRGTSETTPGDVVFVTVFGVRQTGQEDSLYKLDLKKQDFDLSAVSATQYPYIKLRMTTMDSVHFTPYQLRYWRLLYQPAPEGALAPSILYKAKDTLELGEELDFAIAFKNISQAPFADSIKVNMVVLDRNNVSTTIPVNRLKKLLPGDTASVHALIDTRTLSGNNTLYVNVNPDFDQPEQYLNNNFLYKNFYVKGDNFNPLMDVTFDGVHILNGDIVSAKPKILIKLKDESKFLALNDTALASVFVRYPGNNGALQRFAFGTDTLRFVNADLGNGKNEASIEFSPAFLQDSDGDFYELIVKAKDRSGNPAGNTEYKVRFQVYNKPMISNMFNYPNPFTSSTAFVFTITGSQIPQNLRIQIMTVTGKIVKDITRAELGDLRIGRNITDYKWDGTDQYGQKLANGIYLYRVITNLNGSSLDKFNTIDTNGDRIDTDKFFNKGYGKMYLMR